MAKMVIKMVSETEAQVTKAFAKNAVIFGTEEYKLWREYRKDFPNAKMVTKTIKKNPEKKTYRRFLIMTNVERVERDIAREKMFREAFMNGKEPTDEDRAAWALADAHNQMSLDYARQLDAKEAVTNIKISSEVKIKK